MDNLTITRSLVSSPIEQGKFPSQPIPTLNVDKKPEATPSAVSEATGTNLPADQTKTNFGLPELQAAVKILNSHSQLAHQSLRFQVDDSTGKITVSVIDDDSGNVIRQIPPEVTVRLAANNLEPRGVLTNIHG